MLSTQWTDETDEQLTEAVARFGEGRWSEIAELVEGRTGKQCRERWKNEISSEVKKGAWTVDEDALIVVCVSELGPKWSEISKRFVGRTDNAIKNRYNSEMRKYKRAEQRAIREAAAAEERAKHPPGPKHPQAERPRPEQESRPSTALLQVPRELLRQVRRLGSWRCVEGVVNVAEAQVAAELTTEGKQRVASGLRRTVCRHVEATEADAASEAGTAAKQCPTDARRARRRSAPPPPPAMLEPGAMAAPNGEAAAEVEELPCGATAVAAATVPEHRAKRPRLWQRWGAHDADEELGAAPPRRSRRDKPTLEVGRRVRATFEIDRKPLWFFGAVLATASADGNLLVGFDDGKQEHMRADRLTIVDDDDEV